MNDPERNKKLLNDIFARLAEGNAALLVESMDDTIRWTTPGPGRWGKTYEGKKAVVGDLLRTISSQLAAPYKARAVRIIAEGEHAVVEVRGAGNRTKAGVDYDNQYCWVCTLRDGKITSIDEYCDTELITAAFGSPQG
jgi:ketosteroid isomerase-like protein